MEVGALDVKVQQQGSSQPLHCSLASVTLLLILKQMQGEIFFLNDNFTYLLQSHCGSCCFHNIDYEERGH